MSSYVIFAKYSAAALASVREAGYQSRVPAMHAMIGSLGGSVERIMFFDSCNWDFMLLVDGEEDMIFAMGSAAGASGTFERFDVLPGRSPEQMDAIVQRQYDWTPPGS
ncbi:MAG: hypothetical protein AB7G23_19695 [Vicinamibacterales bacterium]